MTYRDCGLVVVAVVVELSAWLRVTYRKYQCPLFIHSPVHVEVLFALSQGRVAYALLWSRFVLCVLARPTGNCVVDFM